MACGDKLVVDMEPEDILKAGYFILQEGGAHED